MVNFNLNAGSLMGILLAFGGIGLYFLRSFRPNLARDYDVFFAAVGLLCGGILFFHSWRLDPILQFGVFLLTGSSVFFATDSVRLRGIATEQAKRGTPVVDDDRPVSRVYRYEADSDNNPAYGYDSFDQDRQPPARRIRGSQDSVSTGYGEGYDDPPYRGNSDRGNSDRSSGRTSRGTRRPPTTPPADRRDAYSGEGDPPEENYGVDPRSNRRPRSRNTPPARGTSYSDRPSGYENSGYSDEPRRDQTYSDPAYGSPTRSDRPSYEDMGSAPDTPSPRRPKRRPPASRPSAPIDEATPYVDYRPLDNEIDNSAHFDN